MNNAVEINTFVKNQNRSLRIWTYWSRLFLSLTLGFSLYVNSSFLATIIDPQYVGVIFTISALLAIIILFKMPIFLARYGNINLMATLAFVSIMIIPPMVTSTSPTIVIALFTLHYILSLMIRYCLDLYLEHLSEDTITAGIRGIFVIALNGPLLLSSLLVGVLLGESSEYGRVYFAAALCLLPFIAIASSRLEENKEKYRTLPVFTTLKRILLAKNGQDKKIHQVLALDFLLNFFYVIMVIYTPIYLHEFIGLSWQEIGITFAIMHIPFILLPLPLGWIADTRLGEKELMSAGLIITGIATIAFSFISAPTLWVWALILLLTRVGAATIETMKEAYLFKNISAGDVSILSISRNTIPLAYIMGPLVATAFLSFVEYRFVFVFLGLTMLYGLRYSLVLKDTR